MLNIGVAGCTGKLGTIIIKNILTAGELKLSSAVGRKGNQFIGKDISEIVGGEYKNILISDEIQTANECDVFIDCTNADSFLNQNFEQYLNKRKPVVIATTGFSDDDFIKIKRLSNIMPIMFSANYSFALYIFIESLKLTAKNISPETDIHIIELHHNQKKDVPSGTAIKPVAENNPARSMITTENETPIT